MKKIYILLPCLCIFILLSCKKDKTSQVKCYICTGPDDTIGYIPARSYTVLVGSLPTQTLDSSKNYLIKGTVIVEAGNVLTIPAGTKLFGEKATKGILVIKPGGQIIAEGTTCNPIIFTSNQEPGLREQGDWGGLVILGNANINQEINYVRGISTAITFGSYQNTSHDNESSGVLKYARIEYGGRQYVSGQDGCNGLTLGAVGSGTTIDHIQVSYSGSDSYAWFGGKVNCYHLIAFASWDDDFDTDNGYTGGVQYAIAIRDPFNADQSGSNGFESDNDATGSYASPKTAPIFSNVTLLGPVYDSAKAAFSSNYKHTLHLRRNTELSLFNSVIVGYPIGLNLDGTLANYTNGNAVLDHNILVCQGVKGETVRTFFNGSSSDNNVATYWTTTRTNEVYTVSIPSASLGSLTYSKCLADAGIEPTLIMGFNTVAGVSGGTYPQNPDLASFTGITQKGADFSNAKLSSWFNNTTFRGAFGAADWTDCWANFNTQNLKY